MKQFLTLPKLKPGDQVAMVSPSFVAPAIWPHVYQLGLKRLREDFGLVPVEFPSTSKLGASGQERAADLLPTWSRFFLQKANLDEYCYSNDT